MSPELARLKAAQARAGELVAAVAEPLTDRPHLVVSVTDPETGQRLATGFATFNVAPVLHVVGGGR